MYSELCGKLVGTPTIGAVDEISIWQQKHGDAAVKVNQKILWPQRMFSCLYHDHPEVFKQSVLGHAEEPRRFWDAMEGNPSYHTHPVSTRKNHKTHCVPLCLHGDVVSTSGVGKSWARSCEAFHWRSLLAKQATAITPAFLIFVVFAKLMLKAENLNGLKPSSGS